MYVIFTYTTENEHGYSKSWFEKGNSLWKWQFFVSMLDFWSVHLLYIIKINQMYQMIQAVTFLSPICRSPKTFEGVTFSPSRKGHLKNCQVGKFTIPGTPISKNNQWLFLVPLIGGRWYIITQLAIYKWYISGIYCQLGTYIHLPPIMGTRKQPLIWVPVNPHGQNAAGLEVEEVEEDITNSREPRAMGRWVLWKKCVST